MCSQHFILGKPAYLYYDEANPDWLPMLLLGHAKKKANSSKKVLKLRFERKKARREAAKEMEVAQSLLLLAEEIVETETIEMETGVATQTD